MLSFFPRDVLDEILNLIESVSEGFPSHFCIILTFELHEQTTVVFGILLVFDMSIIVLKVRLYLLLAELFPVLL